MSRRWRSVIGGVVVLLSLSAEANAAPIGTFEWAYDVLFGTGSTFNITNTSTGVFEDTFVDLYAPAATTPFQTISFGDVDSGGSAQSIDDLSVFLVPDDLARVQLRLTFDATPVTAQLLASDLQGLPTLLLIGATDITGPAPTNVPEPPSVSLMLLGFAATAFAARRRKHASA